MTDTAFVVSDDARSRLRLTVAAIEREISSLSGKTATSERSGSPTTALTKAWADLVHQLDLGPEPERRECPNCHNFGMAKATVCGFCWKKLTPVSQ